MHREGEEPADLVRAARRAADLSQRQPLGRIRGRKAHHRTHRERQNPRSALRPAPAATQQLRLSPAASSRTGCGSTPRATIRWTAVVASSRLISMCDGLTGSVAGGATGHCSAATRSRTWTPAARRRRLTSSRSRRDGRRAARAEPNPPQWRPCPPHPRPTLPASASWLVERRVIPVTRRLLADAETPFSVYRSSPRPARARSCWSPRSRAGLVALLVRWRPSHATLTERDGEAHWIGLRRSGSRPSATRSRRCGRPSSPAHRRLPGLPPLTGGLVGFLGYDAVRRLERLPDLTPTTSVCPRSR